MTTPRPPSGAVVVGTGFGCLTHVRALRAADGVAGMVVMDAIRTSARDRNWVDIDAGAKR